MRRSRREYAIPGTAAHVTAASVVAAASGQPEYCDVRGYVEPAVQFELKLPTTTFNGRYVQYGCSGLCGLIFPTSFPACGAPPGPDFAVAATDDGHVGEGGGFLAILDGTWAANNQAARDDYFYRGPHVVSLASKRIIAEYYGSPPVRSYFDGCSTGGREALLLAQRYQHDFNGITAGAPAAFMGPLNGVSSRATRTPTATFSAPGRCSLSWLRREWASSPWLMTTAVARCWSPSGITTSPAA